MYSKQSINIIELCFTMMLFLLGSAIILGVGIEAKKYAWVAILLTGVIAIVLFQMYVYIWEKNNYQSLTRILKVQFGTHFGNMLAILYVIYFSLIASRVLIDFIQFINNSLLHNMHPFFIKFSMLFLLLYTILKGLDSFIQSAIILGGLTVIFIMVMFMFMSMSGLFHLDYIQPFFPIQFNQITKTIMPTLITFPFGELVAFLTLFPFLKEKTSLFKGGSIVILICTLILSLSSFLTVCVLHPELARFYVFPLVEAIERVHVLNYIQRLDIIAVFIFIIGGFFKIAVFTFASIYVAKDCLPRVKPLYIISIIFVLIFLGSNLDTNNPSQHIKVGLEVIPVFIHIPFQIILPLCILVITHIRLKFSSL
ncbi:TPA: GerAB/ArcD/ProY family transporter [Bacillus cereus]|nr:GerAB/ArcD/ProY family transporter [Bacillus cereus]